MKFDQLIELIRHKEDRPLVIAVDGRAASGKTTLADSLSKRLSASVIHMDDFFLPREMRTDERLSQPGGNLHYERFCREVLPNLAKAEDFRYQRFDCAEMAPGDWIKVCKSDIYIVEGSYSHHPVFGDYAHVKIFMDISPEKQMLRIVQRNGAQRAEVFRRCWIPMEESYFAAYSVKENSDIVLDTTV